MDYKLHVCVLLVVYICEVQCQQEKEILSGQVLLDISKRINDPLMRLLGRSFANLENKVAVVENLVLQADIEKQVNATTNLQEYMERKLEGVESNITQVLINKYDKLSHDLCELYTCSEWSQWDRCDAAIIGDFGVKSRSRDCGNLSPLCKGISDIKNETESTVCQDVCPPDYETTKYGFCVKLYTHLMETWHDAEISCKRYGGHLIHIDSERKSDDVIELLNRYSTDRVWVDGIQMSDGALWKFRNGSVVSGFTNWLTDQPNGSTFPNCIYLLPADWKWADFPCGSYYSYVCEIQ